MKDSLKKENLCTELERGIFAYKEIDRHRVVCTTLRETTTKTMQKFKGRFDYILFDEACQATEA
jgi:superfamily I DNA and/or RNA helicase